MFFAFFLGRPYNKVMDTFFNKIRYYDYHIYLFFHNAISGRPWLNGFYLFFAKYGIVLCLLSFIYLVLKRKIEAFITSFVAMGFAITADFFISMFWRRPSPYLAHSDEVLTPITHGLKVSATSFPSVHTYIAFAIATSIFLYGHKRLGSALFVVAALIGIGRVGAGLHYPTDVIGGAFLGIASGILAFLLVHSAEKRWK